MHDIPLFLEVPLVAERLFGLFRHAESRAGGGRLVPLWLPNVNFRTF